MSRIRRQETVPATMRSHYSAIIELTDLFCETFLNDDYATLAKKAAAALCRDPRFTLKDGEYEKWACGILYAVGHINFLFATTSAPYLHPSTLCTHFGVGQSEGSKIARIIRERIRMRRFEPEWFVRSRLGSSPGVWMIMLDGKIVDARHVPYELQILAHHKGLIPFIPERAKAWQGTGELS